IYDNSDENRMTFQLKQRGDEYPQSPTWVNSSYFTDVPYYIIFTRRVDVFTAQIYADSGHTNELASLSFIGSNINYRYLIAASSYDGNDDGFAINGFVENIVIVPNLYENNLNYIGGLYGAGNPNYLDGVQEMIGYGDYLFVSSYLEYCITILDITSPEDDPIFVSKIDINAVPRKADISNDGNYLFVGTETHQGYGNGNLTIINVTDKSNPVIEGNILLTEGGTIIGSSYVDSINVCFLSGYSDNRLYAINCSNFSNPTLISSKFVGDYGLHGIWANETVAVLCAYGNNNVRTYDVSDTTNMFELDSQPVIDTTAIYGESNPFMYIASLPYDGGAGNRAVILDISDPSNIVLVSSTLGLYGALDNEVTCSVVPNADQTLMYVDSCRVEDNKMGVLYVYNITDKSNPVLLSYITETIPETFGQPTSGAMVIKDNYTYCGLWEDDGVAVFRFTDEDGYQPVASFNYSIDNFSVIFDASSSYDPDGEIVTWMWDFGDNDSGSGIFIEHTYSNEGEYLVTLTVTDNEGSVENYSEIVEISGNDITYLEMIPSENTIVLGDLFNITIFIDPVETIGGWEIFQLDFTQEQVDATEVTPGSYWIDYFDPGVINNDNGTITVIQSWTNDTFPDMNHTACIINFTALQPGVCTFEIVSAQVSNSDFLDINIITESVTISVTNPPVVYNEYPVDFSTDVERPPTILGLTVVDPDGDFIDIYVKWIRNDYYHVGEEVILQSYIDAINGTYNFIPSGNDWIWGDTTYTWKICVNDGVAWTNETYTFTTDGSRYDVSNNDLVNFQDAGLVWVHRTSEVPYDGLYDVNNDGQVNFQDAGLTWINRD
ncbi:MAG: hypothetical protein DRN27_08855, partial [Thermoplasmata archaeon]